MKVLEETFGSVYTGHEMMEGPGFIQQYIALLFYIILWYEQKCVAGSIMKNNNVYCLIGVCSCFVILWWCVEGGGGGYGMAKGCFKDVVQHSSKNYHPEQVTEPRRALKYVPHRLGRCNVTFPQSFPFLQVISVIKHCCILVNTNSCHVAHHIQHRAFSSAASELG